MEDIIIDRVHWAPMHLIIPILGMSYTGCITSQWKNIIPAAWQKGTINFDRAAILILPVLFRNTLLKRGTMKPFLENCLANVTYRWI